MSRRRLTRVVRDGLRTLAGYVEAGSCSDILGQDVDDSPETRVMWKKIERAVEWIRSLDAADPLDDEAAA